MDEQEQALRFAQRFSAGRRSTICHLILKPVRGLFDKNPSASDAQAVAAVVADLERRLADTRYEPRDARDFMSAFTADESAGLDYVQYYVDYVRRGNKHVETPVDREASAKQMAYLKVLGYDGPVLTRGEASYLIAELLKERAKP